MKNIYLLFLLLLSFLLRFSLVAQDAPMQPTKIQNAVYFDVSEPLCNMTVVLPAKKDPNELEKEVPNKIGKNEFSNLKSIPFTLSEDPVWQKTNGTYQPLGFGPIQNFDGMPNIAGYYPPDTQGDVSTDKYVQVVNVNFAIYSKTGTLLFGPAALSTIWSGIPAPWNGTDSGDPIVLYDQAANRWIISQFSLPSGSTTQYAELVAVSQTSDPTGAWYRYVFQYNNIMPDYPKFGVWPDGYYMSANNFVSGSTWGGITASVFERSKMLAGDATARMISFNLGASSEPSSILPSDWDGVTPPALGEPNHFTYYNSTTGPATYLRIWDFHVDWVTPANSTFAQTTSLTTAAFDPDLCSATRERCIPQPGTTVKLEALSDRLMYRLQYRNFGSYQSMVTNHTVDVDGSGHAGIRWYELRNSGSGWSIYQQGTWSPDAAHRWVGSIAMNGNGDIALGYSVSDATTVPNVFPSIRYTGRRNGDPLGTMTVTEQSVIAGTGCQTGTSARWGDYSMMSVDPSDDKTFWFTTEYVEVTGTTSWKTRIASFNISNAPSAVTTPASALTPVSATLNGTVNPSGLATNYHFEYGTTSSYGSSTPVVSAGSGSAAVAVNAAISGLITGATYHFRLVATNSDATSNSSELTFVPGSGTITTTIPSSVTGNSASTGGNINYNGGLTVMARGVCWSTVANPTILDLHTTDGSGSGIFTSSLVSLPPGTTFHVRAYATNSACTFYGDDFVFTTGCAAFGLPFTESFNGTTIPDCWSQIDHQGNNQVWKVGTINGYTSNPILNGNYAYLNSDAYLSGNSQNADLVSPQFDLSGFVSVNLSFNHYFRYYSPSSCAVSYSIDNGATWVLIQSFTATTANPATFSLDLPALAGQSQVKFKWNFTGTWAYYWAIDDIHITGLPVNRQLANIIVLNGVTNCYNATQTITVAGSGTTFTVVNGGNTTLIAGLRIDMLPGTSVQSGGYLNGYIAPSGPFCANQNYLVNNGGNSNGKTPDLPTTVIGDHIKVYPNPTNGKFTLEITGDVLPANFRAEIYNMRGERIISKEIISKKTEEFSLTDEPVGLYFIRVYTGEKTETLKIIKY